MIFILFFSIKLSEGMKGEAGDSLMFYGLTPEHPRVALVGLGTDPATKSVEPQQDLDAESASLTALLYCAYVMRFFFL